MIKIAHVREVQMAKDYPQEVVKVIQEIATILDNEYGENRDVDGGDGEDYTNSLIIMNNDFAVSLIMPLRITPALLKKKWKTTKKPRKEDILS